MQDRELYTRVLGLVAPWTITEVELNAAGEEIEVHIEAHAKGRMPCPECGVECGIHDRRERRWRHLDTCEYRTMIVAQVPRVRCSEHGVRQVGVPWGEPGSRFTSAFEAFAIGWLLEANVSAVARRLRLSWDQVDGIMHRAEQKICFDKFHVAKHLGDAVDKVRRQEQRAMLADGDRSLVGTKYTWLRNPEALPPESADFFDRMKRVAIQTARAWALKEQAMCLWHYTSRTWARKAWTAWISWALRSRLEPVRRVARMVKAHLEGIINAIVLRSTNAAAESVNAKIQRVKRMACGFRNRERFRNAIYFHVGGLDLLPASHTKP